MRDTSATRRARHVRRNSSPCGLRTRITKTTYGPSRVVVTLGIEGPSGVVGSARVCHALSGDEYEGTIRIDSRPDLERKLGPLPRERFAWALSGSLAELAIELISPQREILIDPTTETL